MREGMEDIKLFVSCHRLFSVPAHPLLKPIQVGASLTDEVIPGFFRDDTGDNISRKNRSYCELTAQYWAWKNCASEYYGFFHYRRYLYPDANAKRPYTNEKEPTLSTLEKLGYDGFDDLIRQYDMIVPLGEKMYVPVRKHYSQAPFHRGEDLTLAEEILRDRYPSYGLAAETYLAGSVHYFGNIFIMRREVFLEYCRWLFEILEEFDRRRDTSDYQTQERRVDGYLAERLLGIFYTRERNRLRTLELPRVCFGAGNFQTLLYHVLPPGTRRRSVAKRMVKNKA